MSVIKAHELFALPSAIRSLMFTRATAAATRSSHLETTRPFSTSPQRHTPSADQASTSPNSSVNQTEVSHFNALASSWWDPHGSSRLLHLMNPLRHTFLKQCLDSHVRDDSRKLKFLDIGCGGGIYAESAARLANTQSVTAIDPSPEVIAVASQHRRQDPSLLEPGRLTYLNTAIENLPLPSTPTAGYDIISLFEVIEHIQKPSPFLQSCLAHLKPGGWLIGSTIARTNTSWFTTKFMAEDVLRLVPRGTHDWNQYIQPREMRSWAKAQPDLQTEGKGWQVMGVVYVPGLGWKEVPMSEDWGNYFFGIRKKDMDG